MGLKDVVYGSADRVYALLLDRHESARSLRFVCGAAAVLGFLLLLLTELAEPGLQWPDILDKLALDGGIALIVAALIGASYEAYRERLAREEHSDSTIEALSELARPEQMLRLVADIVEQLPHIPTLFRAARLETKEYSFIRDHALLHNLLILAESRSGPSILQSWLFQSRDPKLRFLASDIVGLYQIGTYVEEMEKLADEHISRWDSVSPEDRWWVLNYKWAASRCDLSQYESLERLLTHTTRVEIETWILFVPCQMPSIPLSGMVERYLESRAHTASPAALSIALDALARLDLVESQSQTVDRHSDRFVAAGLHNRLLDVRIEMNGRPEHRRRALREWQRAARRKGVVDIQLDL